jgi:cellulose synthase operon protein C
MSLPGSLRPVMFALIASASVPLSGCAGAGHEARFGRVEGTVTPIEVRDPEFAASVHRVLRDGKPSADRLGLLIGVVRTQLAHAQRRFATGHASRATDSVMGALYLVRAGEGRGEMIDGTGSKAIAGAIERVSPRGDEGRAEALMRMRLATVAPGSAERADLEAHLRALETWTRETRTGGPLRKLGADQRASVSRSLIEPSEESLGRASRAISAWIDRAIQYNIEFQQTGRRPEREEAIEASRALETGGESMAALFLRHGDARGALESLEKTNAHRVTQPGLYARIRSAAVNDGAKDWQALAAAMAHRGGGDAEDADSELDPELRAAGVWGTALEAYRRDPSSFEVSMLLGRLLVRFGVPEAAPLVTTEALLANPTQQRKGAAMELMLTAMMDAAEIEDAEAARRTFRAGAALLAEGDKGPSEPSSSRARFLMASIEVRSGNLAEARPLLQAAVAREPSTQGFTTLAMVERQAGNTKAALDAVSLALRAPDARSHLIDVAEANLLAYQVHRDGGANAEAKVALDAGLAASLAARQQRGNAATRARAERLLGRILEGYGERKGAARAFERALLAAAADRSTLGAAMLDAIGRALIRRDIVAARMALKKGLDGDVGEDDLVYGGLWVQLLEREQKVPPDGTVERALRAGSRSTWTAKLTAWAAGKISDNDLSSAAQNAAQRVEAAFYTAMARKIAGDPAAEQRLRAVASAPVIDLLEVQLARELLAPSMRANLPGGVQLP